MWQTWITLDIDIDIVVNLLMEEPEVVYLNKPAGYSIMRFTFLYVHLASDHLPLSSILRGWLLILGLIGFFSLTHR